MIRFFLLKIFLLLTHGNFIETQVPVLDGRIVGGEDANIESFPYQVSVRLFDMHTCGGCILNGRVVITASHCFNEIKDPSYFSIQYGLSKIGGEKNVIAVERILTHPQFVKRTFDNDVALIFLISEISFGANARPIKLVTKEPAPGTLAVVTGWGSVKEGSDDTSSILQRVDVIVSERSLCKIQFSDRMDITHHMVCAGISGNSKDACQGDSGGPLVGNNELIGIVSFGYGCARPGYDGIYTNVADFIEWINKNIQ